MKEEKWAITDHGVRYLFSPIGKSIFYVIEKSN